MQCREVRDLLDSYLGQELMVETTHELMRHLETCPECRAELEDRRQLRTVVRRAFANADALQPRPDFAMEALARLRTAPARRAVWSPLRTWGALAATALLVVAAGLLLMVRNRVSIVVRDAVGDHRNCAVKFALTERPIPLDEAAARYDPLYARLQDTPPDELVTAAGALRVVERHSCVFAGRRFGHVVMQLEGHLVSLLVTRGGEPSPGRSSTDAVAPTWLPRVDGQQVASFTTPGHIAFIVSDLPDEPFRTVARAMAMPIASRLTVRWYLPPRVGD